MQSTDEIQVIVVQFRRTSWKTYIANFTILRITGPVVTSPFYIPLTITTWINSPTTTTISTEKVQSRVCNFCYVLEYFEV